MKKCPYCAESIQEEAIVCRYCGRDLPPKTGAVGEAESAMPIETKPTFAQLMALGEFFARSWRPSAERLREITKMGSGMVTEIVAPIFDRYLASRILSESIVKDELVKILEHSYLWSFACFGIGVERGVGNLTSDDAVKYLLSIGQAYGTHLTYYLGKLVEKDVISRQDAALQSRAILMGVISWGNKIEELGSREYASAFRSNDDFLRAVISLDL